jgi:hypothetical protein
MWLYCRPSTLQPAQKLVEESRRLKKSLDLLGDIPGNQVPALFHLADALALEQIHY